MDGGPPVVPPRLPTMPFVLVDVALDEQDDVRLIGRLLDGPDAPCTSATVVTVAFEDLGPGVAVPAFALEPSR